MKKKPGPWDLIKFFMGVIILPLFGAITFILNSISSFQNVNSFKNRPRYVYDSAPPGYNGTDIVYVIGEANCSTPYTQDMVNFVNNIPTGYIIFVFVFCFIFCTCSFIVGTGLKFAHVLKTNPKSELKRVSLVSTIFSYGSFVFSVPVSYSSKVTYGECLEIEGIFAGYMNSSIYLMCNMGMWFLLLLAFYYAIRNHKGIRRYERNPLVKLILIFLWIYAILFLVLALITKFGSILSFQIGWDISLSIDLAYGSVSLKFEDWDMAKVTPLDDN